MLSAWLKTTRNGQAGSSLVAFVSFYLLHSSLFMLIIESKKSNRTVGEVIGNNAKRIGGSKK